MARDVAYRKLLEPLWDSIDIYGDPEEFLRTFGQTPRELGVLFAANFCLSEVQNGGFEQFFDNSTGVLAPEAVEGFAAIGLPETGKVVEEAMELFGSPYIRNRQWRQAALEILPEGCFAAMDQQFYSLMDSEAGGFPTAADAYAKRVSG